MDAALSHVYKSIPVKQANCDPRFLGRKTLVLGSYWTIGRRVGRRPVWEERVDQWFDSRVLKCGSKNISGTAIIIRNRARSPVSFASRSMAFTVLVVGGWVGDDVVGIWYIIWKTMRLACRSRTWYNQHHI